MTSGIKKLAKRVDMSIAAIAEHSPVVRLRWIPRGLLVGNLCPAVLVMANRLHRPPSLDPAFRDNAGPPFRHARSP
ncbi:hypothetical protein ACOMHN_029445 [Nucella lapillus]